MVTRENIARCCMSCDSNKGTKDLDAWLRSGYCRRKGITERTVAEVVRKCSFGFRTVRLSRRRRKATKAPQAREARLRRSI